MSEPIPGLSVSEAASKLLEINSPQGEDNSPKGEDAEPQAQATPAEPSEVEEQTSELTEEVEASEAQSSEDEQSSDDEVEAKEVEVPDETEQFLSDLNDWITDSSHHEKIEIPTKVNGKEGKATLAELLANHQIESAASERLDALKSDRAKFEKEKEALESDFNARLNTAAELVDMLEQQVTGMSEKVNWDELKENDPAEYSAKKLELNEKQERLKQTRQAISQEQKANFQKQFKEIAQREARALADTFPQWSDETKAKQDKTAIREYLLSSGFSPQEVDGSVDSDGNVLSVGIIDHRLIKVAHDAMMFNKGEKKLDVTKKRVKKLPKVARPGKPKGDTDEIEAQKKLRGRLKKSGRVDDAAALLRNFGG